MRTGRLVGTLMGALAAIAFAAPSAWAQPAMRVGHALRDAGEPYSMSGKAQAKAAWVDGAWWAVLSSAKGMDLMRLQGTTWVQETVSGGSHLSDDPNMRADVIFDGDELIVVATNNSSIRLWVFQYSRPSFRLRSGFPVLVAGGSSADPVATDVATVAQDSRGRLWVAYRAGTSGYVKASTGVSASGWTTFRAAIQFGYLGNGVSGEASNNAVVAFNDDTGPKIGVVWADQSAPPSNAYRFRWRSDSSTGLTINDWQPEEQIYASGDSGEHVANDQLSVVSFEGRIFVAAKSDTSPASSAVGMDRFYLFVRSAAGVWAKQTLRRIERSGDTATRPVLAVDGERRRLYAMWHDLGIEGKVTSIDNPNFLSATLTSFISPTSTTNWDVQTSHQILNSRTGLLVLADDNNTGWQYWNLVSLGVPESGAAVPTLSSITVTPPIAQTTSFGQVQFSASGRDQAGRPFDILPGWSTNGGSIDSTGLYTAPATLGVYGVAATQSETGHGTVFVSDEIPALARIDITPDPATVVINTQQQLTLVGRSPTGSTVSLAGVPITWAVTNGVGSITTTGLYSAPSSENRAFIRATARNLTAFGTVLIVPKPPASGGSGGSGGSSAPGPLARIVVTPTAPTIAPSGTIQFSAQGQDAAGRSVSLSEVSWSASNGTISTTGAFTAPANAGTAVVTATSKGVSGSATVTISAPTQSGFTGGGGGGGGGGGCAIETGRANAGSVLPLLVVALALVARRRRG